MDSKSTAIKTRLSITCLSTRGFPTAKYAFALQLIHVFWHLGQGASILSPGIHSFPFKLGLPLGLPSTFLGKHGWIQYYCKAALREPNGLTHKNQQVFIVMNPIDLNLEPPILAVSKVHYLLTNIYTPFTSPSRCGGSV
jgi:Arrestin (or S-antigen), N-terminal domain